MSPNQRQTRGVLWDVIAPWVRWPLHSPRRLFAVLGGVVVLMVLWHVASRAAATTQPTASATSAAVTSTAAPSTPSDTAPAPASTMTAMPTGTLPGTTPSASVGTSPAGGNPSDPTDPAVPAGSAEAAQGFVTAWARPSLPADQWLSGVRGYVAPELERSMSYTDPARIDATTVTGPARMVHVLPDGSAATFEVPTDAGATRVELALVKGRWLATDIVPASAAAPGD
ncbi:hypothetical protein ACWEOW_02870 [Monashia sp. NPDC004114]